MRLHVLYAVDRKQVVGCAVSMRSILEHVSPDADVQFHVMTRRLRPRDLAALRRTVLASGRRADLGFYEIDFRRIAHLWRSRLVSRTAYARLFLGEVLPATVTRCIYLDCDTVVVRDIAEAWESDLGGRTIGAVADGGSVASRAHQERVGLAEARYFNSGFAVIDVARWRERGVGARALAHAAEPTRGRRLFVDQDALNRALEGDWQELPNVWNARVEASPWLTADSLAVFHFTSSPKPWQADYQRRFREVFLHHLDLTAYAGRRAWNPGGWGARFAKLRRAVPYLPAVLRLLIGSW